MDFALPFAPMFAHLRVFRRHPASRATAIGFLAFGFLFGSWTAMIPFVKQKFALDEGGIGLLLLTLQGGVLVMNPLSVPLLHRLGAVRSSLISLGLSSFSFVAAAAMPSVWSAGAALFFAGMTFSFFNVSINTCASALEVRESVRIMSASHGFWSAGAMLGAVAAGAILGSGVSPTACFSIIAAVEVAVIFLISKPLKKVPDERPAASGEPVPKKGFTMPTAALWSLIIMSLCTNLTEGTMADWSAIYLREVSKAPDVMISWGFGAYAFCMAAGRFLGDGLIVRFGERMVLRTGAWVVFSGLLTAVFLKNPAAAIAGFALVGAGVSIGAPILYAAAARTPGMAKGAGLATLNTFAMLGFFGGPVMIGFLARAFSLPLAFAVVAGLVLVWVWKSSSMKK